MERLVRAIHELPLREIVQVYALALGCLAGVIAVLAGHAWLVS